MERDQWIDPLGRSGLASRGVVYLLLAWLTVEVALGRTTRPDDAQGALSAVASHPLGWVVVVAVAAGLAGLASWQASIAARRDPGPGRRAVAAGKAIGYAALAALAVEVVVKHGHGGGSPAGSMLMTHIAGRVVIGLVGTAIGVGGLVLIIKGGELRYDVDVRPPRHLRRAFAALGAVGMVGRGAVFMLVGGFLVDAAVTAQPGKAQGLDSALRSLARQPAGPWLLALVAFGLAAFGCFSAIEARQVRT